MLQGSKELLGWEEMSLIVLEVRAGDRDGATREGGEDTQSGPDVCGGQESHRSPGRPCPLSSWDFFFF